jgi:hypothetical protein
MNTAHSAPKFGFDWSETTEITGRTAARASGKSIHNERRTWCVGDRTTIIARVEASDGGTLTGQYTVEIVKLGVGTEYGMRGTTGIALLRYVGDVPVDKYGADDERPRGREFHLALRHLTAPAVKARR